MPNGEGVDGFVTRHSIKPKGEDAPSQNYPGISESGETLATKERAAELLGMLDAAPDGAVMFISGVPINKDFTANPAMLRTRSTAEAYGDGMQELAKGRDDVAVYTRSDIEGKRGELDTPEQKANKTGEGLSRFLSRISAEIAENPHKKVAIDFPLFLNEMSVKPWLTEDGTDWSEFMYETMAKHPSEYDALKEYIGSGGKVTTEDGRMLVGPDPAQVAEGHKQALIRLHTFAKQYLPNRPLIIGLTDHSWLADAFLVYAATGKLDAESVDRVEGGKMIKETEVGTVTIDADGGVTVNYRGRTFSPGLDLDKAA